MFTDLLDSVRFANKDAGEQRAFAEGVLFLTLLNGATPVLSLPQVFDSPLILELGEDSSFIEALHRGYLRVSLYKNASSVKRYMLDRLRETVSKNQANFRFSSLPFLGEYSEAAVTAVYKGMISAMENDEPFKSGNLSKEQAETVDRYLRCITNVNAAMLAANDGQGSFLVSQGPKLELKSLIGQCIRASKDTLKEEDANQGNTGFISEFIEICDRLLQAHNESAGMDYNTRTKNYELLENFAGYSAEGVFTAKALIDHCYNAVVASSIPDDGESDILGLSKETFPLLARAAQAFPTTLAYDDPQMFSCEEKKTALTWGTLNIILEEIKAIQAEQGQPWIEAHHKYDSRQTWLPYRRGAHAGAVTLLLFAPAAALGLLPVGLTLGLMIDFTWGLISELSGEGLKKPSFSEVRHSFKSSREKRRILREYSVDRTFFING